MLPEHEHGAASGCVGMAGGKHIPVCIRAIGVNHKAPISATRAIRKDKIYPLLGGVEYDENGRVVTALPYSRRLGAAIY